MSSYNVLGFSKFVLVLLFPLLFELFKSFFFISLLSFTSFITLFFKDFNFVIFKMNSSNIFLFQIPSLCDLNKDKNWSVKTPGSPSSSWFITTIEVNSPLKSSKNSILFIKLFFFNFIPS